jgi:hypothetical protein
MKIKAYIFCLLVFLNYSCAQTILKNDVGKAQLRHCVKSVQMLTINYEEGHVIKNEGPWDTYVLYNGAGNEVERKGWRMNGRLSFNQVLEYDGSGHIVDKKVYQSNGKLREQYSYRFDEQERQIEKRTHNTMGKIVERFLMIYDEQGNQMEMQCHRFGKISYKYIRDFTADNRLKTFSIYDGDTQLDKQSIYMYHGKGIEITVLDGAGKELSRVIDKMDAAGNLLMKHNYHEGDSLPYKSKTYQYDKEGNEVNYRSYVLGRMLSEKQTNYDKNGRITEQVKYKSNNKFISKCTYKFNRKGSLIEAIDYTKEDTIKSQKKWLFKYDKYRNWIKKSMFESGKLRTVSTRKILYY